MEIDRDAPIVLRHEIEVFAPPEKVWERLSRIELWKEWHPDISDAHWVEGPASADSFKWRAKFFAVTCHLESWSEPREIGWSGRSWFTRGCHVFRLSGDYRSTRVVSEASLSGAVARTLKPVIAGVLDRFGQTWLAALKTRIEAESGPGDGRGRWSAPPVLPSRRTLGWPWGRRW